MQRFKNIIFGILVILIAYYITKSLIPNKQPVLLTIPKGHYLYHLMYINDKPVIRYEKYEPTHIVIEHPNGDYVIIRREESVINDSK